MRKDLIKLKEKQEEEITKTNLKPNNSIQSQQVSNNTNNHNLSTVHILNKLSKLDKKGLNNMIKQHNNHHFHNHHHTHHNSNPHLHNQQTHHHHHHTHHVNHSTQFNNINVNSNINNTSTNNNQMVNGTVNSNVKLNEPASLKNGRSSSLPLKIMFNGRNGKNLNNNDNENSCDSLNNITIKSWNGSSSIKLINNNENANSNTNNNFFLNYKFAQLNLSERFLNLLELKEQEQNENESSLNQFFLSNNSKNYLRNFAKNQLFNIKNNLNNFNKGNQCNAHKINNNTNNSSQIENLKYLIKSLDDSNSKLNNFGFNIDESKECREVLSESNVNNLSNITNSISKTEDLGVKNVEFKDNDTNGANRYSNSENSANECEISNKENVNVELETKKNVQLDLEPIVDRKAITIESQETSLISSIPLSVQPISSDSLELSEPDRTEKLIQQHENNHHESKNFEVCENVSKNEQISVPEPVELEIIAKETNVMSRIQEQNSESLTSIPEIVVNGESKSSEDTTVNNEVNTSVELNDNDKTLDETLDGSSNLMNTTISNSLSISDVSTLYSNNTINNNSTCNDIKIDIDDSDSETSSQGSCDSSFDDEMIYKDFLPKKSCLVQKSKLFIDTNNTNSSIIDCSANATSSPLIPSSPTSPTGSSSLSFSSSSLSLQAQQSITSFSSPQQSTTSQALSTSTSSTASSKKRVSFADGCGKELFTVRTMSEPSNCPPKLTSKIVQYFLNREFNNSTTMNSNGSLTNLLNAVSNSSRTFGSDYINSSSYNRESFFSSTRNYDYGISALNYTNDVNQLSGSIAVYSLNFVQPASDYLKFRKRLQENYVSLENVLLNRFQINGTIKVKNVNYHKNVFIRCSFNNWSTYEDYQAQYVPCEFYSSPSLLSSPTSSSASATFYGSNHADYQPQHKEFDTFRFEFQLPKTVENVNTGNNFKSNINNNNNNNYSANSITNKSNATGSIQFCICYRSGIDATLKEYWDNNYGINYEILQYVIDIESLKPNNSSSSLLAAAGSTTPLTSLTNHAKTNKYKQNHYNRSNYSNSLSSLAQEPQITGVYY